MSQEYLVLYYGTIVFYFTEQSFVFTEQLFSGPPVASSDRGAANFVVCKHTMLIAVKSFLGSRFRFCVAYACAAAW